MAGLRAHHPQYSDLPVSNWTFSFSTLDGLNLWTRARGVRADHDSRLMMFSAVRKA
jgi:hypothetical protein